MLLCYEALLIVCICRCDRYASHVSLVLECGAHSVLLNNEFGRLRTEEPTLLITQINKHADEQQQWNNGNTTGSVSSLADRKDNYSYPPTPSLLFKHPLHHLFFSSHTSLCALSLLLSHACMFFFFLVSAISFFSCIFVSVIRSLTLLNFLLLVIR